MYALLGKKIEKELRKMENERTIDKTTSKIYLKENWKCAKLGNENRNHSVCFLEKKPGNKDSWEHS